MIDFRQLPLRAGENPNDDVAAEVFLLALFSMIRTPEEAVIGADTSMRVLRDYRARAPSSMTVSNLFALVWCLGPARLHELFRLTAGESGRFFTQTVFRLAENERLRQVGFPALTAQLLMERQVPPPVARRILVLLRLDLTGARVSGSVLRYLEWRGYRLPVYDMNDMAAADAAALARLTEELAYLPMTAAEFEVLAWLAPEPFGLGPGMPRPNYHTDVRSFDRWYQDAVLRHSGATGGPRLAPPTAPPVTVVPEATTNPPQQANWATATTSGTYRTFYTTSHALPFPDPDPQQQQQEVRRQRTELLRRQISQQDFVQQYIRRVTSPPAPTDPDHPIPEDLHL